MAPIATWLRETRQRRHLSQEALVALVNAWARETGQVNDQGKPWTLYRPNYVGWEGGKQPTATSVTRLVAYWQAQGEPGPDLTPPAPALSLEERAVIAAEAQASAIAALVAELREWRTADRDRIAGVETSVAGLLAAVRPISREAATPRGPRAPGRSAGSAR